MGQKVHPTAFRIGQTTNWVSRWFTSRTYRKFLSQDLALRRFLASKTEKAGIAKVEIERSGATTTVIISTSRPGVLVGRGGGGIEALKKDIVRLLGVQDREVRVEVREVRRPDSEASLIAQLIAQELLKRLPFRRVMKQTMTKIMQSRDVRGAKIMLSGRLGGAEMSRSEMLQQGQLPLQSLRANIDFAQKHVFTPYGAIGVKVWIYKGEVFDENAKFKDRNSK